MTRTELRLADALDAAATALREDTLRPLLVPQRPRRRAAWLASAAAAASLLLVTGVAAAVAGHLPGSGNGATPPPRYYVEVSDHGDLPVVRSTATGTVTARVQVPHPSRALGPYLVTAAANGLFFTVVPAAAGVQIYRFRLTAAGRVSSLGALPGGALPGSQTAPHAVAASPDGSRVAVAVNAGRDDQIDVVDTADGTRSVWQGGIEPSYGFSVTSLSWTGSGNELVYYGEWCPQAQPQQSPSQEGTLAQALRACEAGTAGEGAKAEAWKLDPASRGGLLTSGRRLFSLPAGPYLPQVVISRDGTTLTALSLRANRAGTPEHLSVEQISVTTGKLSGVLYSQDLGRAAAAKGQPAYLNPISLSADASGQHWMLFCDGSAQCGAGLNGWIDNGRLVPLQPADGSVASEAW